MRRQNAYMTVALALCLTLALTFCLALIEGARQNAGRLETECVTDIALYSVQAEYHRQLMEQYNLFAIDSSYGTDTYGKENVEERLKYYLEKNLNYEDIFLSNFFYRDFLGLKVANAKVTSVLGIMDGNGSVFRNCAVEAIRSDVGLELFEQVQDWLQVIEVNGLESSDVAGQKALVDEQLAAYEGMEVETEKNVWEKVIIENPTENLEEKRKLGILKLALGDEETLSQVVLATEHLAGSRMRQGLTYVGDTVEAEYNSAENLLDKFLFREYLLRYMGHYGAESESDVLKYQAEYLIAGENSDVENLRKVANRICVIREAANFLYLLGNEVKRSEARLMAEVLSTLMLIPWIAPLMEIVILLGWSYAESVYDVKTLLEGGNVPLMKDDESWHYGLASALLGDLRESGSEEGMSYADYLRVFLMLENGDVLTERSMNMVEADMRNTPGNADFWLDACFVSLEADIEFESTYGYEYLVTRGKKYE